jgi:hypothetical protein
MTLRDSLNQLPLDSEPSALGYWPCSGVELARPRAQWTGGQRPRAHAEARRQRRRHGSQEIAAACAAAVAGDRIHSIGAEPVAARFAKWIDALYGEARQVLHARSLFGRQLCSNTGGACGGRSPDGPKENNAGIVRRMPLGVK